jgi:hypothetical protein
MGATIIHFIGGETVTVEGDPSEVADKLWRTRDPQEFEAVEHGNVHVNPAAVTYVQAEVAGGAAAP